MDPVLFFAGCVYSVEFLCTNIVEDIKSGHFLETFAHVSFSYLYSACSSSAKPTEVSGYEPLFLCSGVEGLHDSFLYQVRRSCITMRGILGFLLGSPCTTTMCLRKSDRDIWQTTHCFF